MLPVHGFPLELGRYRLLGLLGQGGMGTVYLAEQRGPLGFQQRLAVKLVDPALAAREPRLLLGLADEARLLARVRHPNVVGLYSFESVDSKDWGRVHLLAMECIEGVTLASILQPDNGPARRVPVAAIRAIASDVLAGLSHAHAACDAEGQPMGIVHRDLNPRNLMIDRTGGTRVLDFGIAWAVEKLVSTATGMTKGTPPYMSPEQLGGEPVDARTDLFVLGEIVYEMLLGTTWVMRPRGLNELVKMGRQLGEVRYADRRATVEQALQEQMHGDTTTAWSRWLAGLLAFEPAGRTPSAADALRQLLAIEESGPTSRGRRWLAAHAAEASEVTAPGSSPTEGTSTANAPNLSTTVVVKPPDARTGVTDPDAVIALDRAALRRLLDRGHEDER